MGKSKRGFRSFDKEKLLEVSRRGGKNAVNRYKFTSAKAREAGLKGAEVRWGKSKGMLNEQEEG